MGGVPNTCLAQGATMPCYDHELINHKSTHSRPNGNALSQGCVLLSLQFSESIAYYRYVLYTNTKETITASTRIIVIVIVISKLLKRYSKAKRTRAPAYSRALRRIKGGFQRGVKRNSGPNSRVPGGDRVAVRVGVVEMGRGMIRRVRVGEIEEMRF